MKLKKFIVGLLMVVSIIGLAGCASTARACKSCNSDMNGGLNRVINIYSLDGNLMATYEGLIDIDNNSNGSIMFDLEGKRYVYYNAIIEVIEK